MRPLAFVMTVQCPFCHIKFSCYLTNGNSLITISGEQAAEYDMPEEDKEKMPEKYETVSLDDFVEYSKSMFEYWTEDDFASSFRKMLTIEQFRSEEMQNLYQQYLVSGPAEYV